MTRLSSNVSLERSRFFSCIYVCRFVVSLIYIKNLTTAINNSVLCDSRCDIIMSSKSEKHTNRPYMWRQNRNNIYYDTFSWILWFTKPQNCKTGCYALNFQGIDRWFVHVYRHSIWNVWSIRNLTSVKN